MVKIAYLIGNGFDIHLGLPSRYTDFYNWLETVFGQDEINKEYKTLEKIKNPLVQELVNEVKIKSNGEEKPLTNAKKWSDFEETLKDRIFELSQNENPTEQVVNLVHNLQDINALMTFYLKKELTEIEKIDKFTPNVVEKSLSKPINQLKPQQLDLLRSLIKDKLSTTGFVPSQHVIEFVNFNYTPLLEMYLSEVNAINISEFDEIFTPSQRPLRIKNEIEYPNGNFDDTPELGIGTRDDLPQNIHLSKILTNYLVKEAFAKNRMDKRVTNIFDTIDSSDIVISYGLSLGKSDDLYLSRIISSLIANPKKFVIIVVYNPNFNPSAITIESMEFELEIKERLIDSHYHIKHSDQSAETDEQSPADLLNELDDRIIVLSDNGKNNGDSSSFMYFPYLKNKESTANPKTA